MSDGLRTFQYNYAMKNESLLHRGLVTSTTMSDWNNSAYVNWPQFNNDFETLFPIQKPPVDIILVRIMLPTLDLNRMWTLSPQNPSFDQSTFNSLNTQSNEPILSI